MSWRYFGGNWNATSYTPPDSEAVKSLKAVMKMPEIAPQSGVRKYKTIEEVDAEHDSDGGRVPPLSVILEAPCEGDEAREVDTRWWKVPVRRGWW